MGSSNFYRDNEDLLFLVKHGLDWEELVRLTEPNLGRAEDAPKSVADAVALYEDLLAAAGEFAAKEVAPKASRIDHEGTWLDGGEVKMCEELEQIFDGFKAMGLYGLTLPRELGGANAPLALYQIANELIARGDVSVMTHFGFHGGIAMALLVYSVKEGSATYRDGRLVKTRWDDAIREICAGDAFGCMVLTEPGAGSDLAAIRTRAVEKEGRWYLNGEKIFITSGHGQYQLVLAKTEDEKAGDAFSGLKALSLFLVPRKVKQDGALIDNVKVTKVEEKLGHHGSATCALSYEDSVGELIGKRGQGFDLMLSLMNSARLGVGFEAIGNSEAAYRAAREYAAERKAMGKPIDQHELVAEKLVNMETWIRAMRAMGFQALNAVEISTRLEMRLTLDPPSNEEERAALEAQLKKMTRRARRLTPLFKYITSEKAVEIARDAMQIHGGMGYIDETGVHKYLRDALVMPVYEGTSQIQALMATKDHLLGATRDLAGFVRRATRARLLARTADDALMREVYRADATVYRATENILLRIFGKKVRSELEEGLKGRPALEWPRYLTQDFLRRWDPKADFSHGLLHAERLTQMLADVEMGKTLARQAKRFPERHALATRFIRRMVLRVEALAREIEHSDESAFEFIADRSNVAKSA